MISAPLSPTSAQNAPQTHECFIVQRCWHSGPQQYQPLDCLRLFTDRRHAEDAAYHSANAWAQAGGHPSADTTVRTLLLPSVPSASKTASYGFVARGSLFWVRSVFVSKAANPSNTSITHASGVCRTNHWLLPPSPTVMAPSAPISTCFAIVTEGVIGGTGNKNSRRGTEEATGRVFAGPDSGFARGLAQHVARKCIARLPDNCHTYVAALPVGKEQLLPANQQGTSYYLDDWPSQVAERFGGIMPRVAVLKRDRSPDTDLPSPLFGMPSDLRLVSSSPPPGDMLLPAFGGGNNAMMATEDVEHFPSPAKRRRTVWANCASSSTQPLVSSSFVTDDEMMVH